MSPQSDDNDIATMLGLTTERKAQLVQAAIDEIVRKDQANPIASGSVYLKLTPKQRRSLNGIVERLQKRNDFIADAIRAAFKGTPKAGYITVYIHGFAGHISDIELRIQIPSLDGRKLG